ncbi:ceramide kinase-like protein [Ptychodera flava]|uniref:ceramide kinase-like protein n=1 Tax=Ptychodera flava TaxID=63121 RepID=UPI00396A9E54
MASSTCLRGIFDIEKGHFDVTLDRETVKWTPISPQQAKLGKSPNEIKLKDVYAVKIKRRIKAGNKGGYPLGFTIFHRKPDPEYGFVRQETTLACVEERLCQLWMTSIRKIIEAYPERPRKLIVLLNSETSQRNSIYRRKVQYLFDYANVSLKEHVTDQEKVAHLIQEMEFTEIDGIVCVGGDSFINEVINALLLRTQKDAHIDTSSYFTPARCMLPLGIISVGPLDLLSYSVHKTNDPVVAALHVIYGDIQPVDVCTMYQDQSFQQFGFTAMYGFTSDFIKKAKKKQWLGPLKGKYAMAKSLVNVQPYHCSIEYLPHDKSELRHACQPACKECEKAEDFKVLSHSKFTIIQEFNQSVDVPHVNVSVASDLRPNVIQVRSLTPDPSHLTMTDRLGVPAEIPRTRSFPGLTGTDTGIDMASPHWPASDPATSPKLSLYGIATISDDSIDFDDYLSNDKWKTVSDSYLNLGILSNSGACSMVQHHGLSPYTHLSDGAAHLILVQNTSKKNFLQHLRRYGTSKDPFDFSFTTMLKVKAVRVSCPNDGSNTSRSSLLEDDSSYNVAQSSQWNIDGNAIHGYNLEIRVHHQLLAIFSGNWNMPSQETPDKFNCIPS